MHSAHGTRTRPARLAALLSALGLTALLSLGAATAASAVDLPDDDALYAIVTFPLEEEFWQLLAIDPETAATTRVGPFTAPDQGDNGWEYQGHYDPVSGLGYYIRSFYDASEATMVRHLTSVDPTTGAHAVVGEIIEDPLGTPAYPLGGPLAIGPGGAYYIDADDAVLYRVDLATGEVEYVGDTAWAYAFAYDAVTDAYYAITADEFPDLVEIDVTDGSHTVVAALGGSTGNRVVALQFDSAGNAWLLANHEVGVASALNSFSLADIGAGEYNGSLSLDGEYVTTLSLLLVPAAVDDDDDGGDDGGNQGGSGTLPDTGAQVTASLAVAGSLLAAGVGLLLWRSRRA